jgi:hypothetical protein
MKHGLLLAILSALAAFNTHPAHTASEEITLDSRKLPANTKCLIRVNGVQLFYGACNYDGLVLNDRRLVTACPKHDCSGASTYIKQNGIFLYAPRPMSARAGSSVPIEWNKGVYDKAHSRLGEFIREGDCWVNSNADSTICIYPLR